MSVHGSEAAGPQEAHRKTLQHSLKLAFQSGHSFLALGCESFIHNPPAPKIPSHTQAFLKTLNPQNCDFPHAPLGTH